MNDSCRYFHYGDSIEAAINKVKPQMQMEIVVMHKDTNVSTLSTLVERHRQVSSAADTVTCCAERSLMRYKCKLSISMAKRNTFARATRYIVSFRYTNANIALQL